MPAAPTTGIVWFRTPDDAEPQFALYQCGQWWARNRWRGWRLCGVQNRRGGAALVGGLGESIRVRLVAGQPCA